MRDKKEHMRLHLDAVTDAPQAIAWGWSSSHGSSIDANGNFAGWPRLISRESEALGAHKIDAAVNFHEAPIVIRLEEKLASRHGRSGRGHCHCGLRGPAWSR